MDADDEYQISINILGKEFVTSISKQEIKDVVIEAYREVLKEQSKYLACDSDSPQPVWKNIIGPVRLSQRAI